MGWLRRVLGWSVGVPSLVSGFAVGYLTNVVTGGSSTWPVIAGLATSVAAAVGLSVGQEASAQNKELARLRGLRAGVLAGFDPPVLGGGERMIVSLLAARNAIAPFVGRGTQVQELLQWCRDGAGVSIRVLAGPSGVGKTRLAAQLARALPDAWAAGQADPHRLGEVVELVRACGDPTLIVVDDADTQPELARQLPAVLGRLGGDHQVLRVLLVVRDAAAFQAWLGAGAEPLDEAVTLRWPVISLDAFGGGGDRKRWFVEALRRYAQALDMPPVFVSEFDIGPVGVDGEPMVVTQIRAALAAFEGGTRTQIDTVRVLGIGELAATLVEHEQRRWTRIAADTGRWGLPPTLTAPARENAVLALVLAGPRDDDDGNSAGVALLHRTGLFGKDVAANLVAWARYLYPTPAGAGSPIVSPAPDFLVAALLARLAEPCHHHLLDTLCPGELARNDTAVLDRLIRAAMVFPTVGALLGRVLEQGPDLLGAAIDAALFLGSDARSVEPVLAVAVTAESLEPDQVSRLLPLTNHIWRHLRVALGAAAVQHARNQAADDDTRAAHSALADALHNLGIWLSEVGQRSAALASTEEAVAIWRRLVEAEPAAYLPDLAMHLSTFALVRAAGPHELDEALTAIEEATTIYQSLAEKLPNAFTRHLRWATKIHADVLGCLGRSAEAEKLRDTLRNDQSN